jgi:hypothetical protein
MVKHACNPSTQKAKAEDHEFKSSLGYTVRLSQKIKIKKVLKQGNWNPLGCIYPQWWLSPSLPPFFQNLRTDSAKGVLPQEACRTNTAEKQGTEKQSDLSFVQKT